MAQQWTGKRIEELALEVRAEIRLGSHERLDVYALAEEHGVPVYSIHHLDAHGCPSEAIMHFTSVRPDKWSAALVPVGHGCLILENSAHSLQRRRANVAHEMAHLLLEHEFNNVLFTDGGCSLGTAGRTKENQAKALSAELLVPKGAAIRAARNYRSDEEVAQHFDVSIEFARMRMNASGARRIAERSRAKYARG
ncbi:Zn-dependent peptidase ImmA (M78 family) [Streptomyces sp. TLI_235]|nr:ImmA/IrrE family metallo-endopeptidase [Streptomyces sp. TLI_235]PBC69689.1 Zn-dependent peptidase ImmA (M78 family) [Streptomyces sp. TLI_235]